MPDEPRGLAAKYPRAVATGEMLMDALLGLMGVGPDTKANQGGQMLGAALPMVGGVKRLGAAKTAALDMSEAARMKRAAQQGYTVDALHGRSGDYDAVAIPSWRRSADAGATGEGFYSTERSARGGDIASFYAEQAGNRPNVMPVKLQQRNPLRIEPDQQYPLEDPRPMAMRRLSEEWGLTERPKFSGSRQTNEAWASEFSRALAARGHDGVVSDLGGATEYMVLSPSQVRSAFAAFDPRKVKSSDLMASLIAMMGGGAAASALQKEQP